MSNRKKTGKARCGTKRRRQENVDDSDNDSSTATDLTDAMEVSGVIL